jgi:hypothetical protein
MKRPTWLSAPNALTTMVIVACCGLGYGLYRIREESHQLRWEYEIARRDENRSTMSLSVGIIQFLKNGFTITLDSVQSTQDGVTLVGRFGNPKYLELSTVTLAFAVERPMWRFREEYFENPLEFLFSEALSVGKAEALVGFVGAGSTAPFRVTIPDVKGSLDNYVVAVNLSGERYSYTR